MPEEEKKEKKIETENGKIKEIIPAVEVKKIEEVPALPEEAPEIREETALDRWKPKTELGKAVSSGTISNIDDVFKTGKRIIEYEIVDKLIPELKNELIL